MRENKKSGRRQAAFDPRAERKTAQVCRVTYQTLSLWLAEISRPGLIELGVLSVEPNPNASCLLVQLVPVEEHSPDDLDSSMEILGELQGWARSEVAAALQRKRAPEIRFAIVAPIAEEEA